MNMLFNSVEVRKPRRNKFNLSHEKKLTCNMGELIPILLQEVVPGDSFRVKSEIMVRFQALLAPVMHRIDVTTHYFFIPNRLLWDNWEEFITGGEDGTSNPLHPFIRYTDANKNVFYECTLADYFGLPTVAEDEDVLTETNVSALPFRAYALLFNEYYRDQNLDAQLALVKTDGADNTTARVLQLRRWEKDYFTSALPFAQRGPQVLMPLEGSGSVTYLEQSKLEPLPNTPGTLKNDNSVSPGESLLTDTAGNPLRLENIDEVTLTNSGVSINDLRRSIRLQEWLEKNARGGGRYVEQIMLHFGERSPDARLQRPEFLGGGRNPVIISEVIQSVAGGQDPDTGEELPLATMGGHGISYGRTNGFSRKFVEHGLIIGIMSVMPRTGYQQGIHKSWTRFDRFDYFWTEFANIGEQEVKSKEVYYNPLQDATANALEDTFGYQSRYADYKTVPSSTHGRFKSSMSFWTLNRIFNNRPELDSAFVASNPSKRIFAYLGDATTSATQGLLVQIYNKVDAIRPMPYFGTPSI